MGCSRNLPVSLPERLFLALDFDGTLAPIVPDPAQAEMPPEAREVVRTLARRHPVMIVSGRGLENVRALVGLDVIYAGNHGMEIRGDGLEFCEPTAAALQSDLCSLCRLLAAKLRDIPGVQVEYKHLTASVHYRRVAAQDSNQVHEIVYRTVDRPFTVKPGKKVLEVRPIVDWNKGAAVRWVCQHYPGTTPIYIGDDATDEDAFAALHEGIAIRVGCIEGSAAQYFLDSPDDVVEFLKRLARES